MGPVHEPVRSFGDIEKLRRILTRRQALVTESTVRNLFVAGVAVLFIWGIALESSRVQSAMTLE